MLFLSIDGKKCLFHKHLKEYVFYRSREALFFRKANAADVSGGRYFSSLEYLLGIKRQCFDNYLKSLKIFVCRFESFFWAG